MAENKPIDPEKILEKASLASPEDFGRFENGQENAPERQSEKKEPKIDDDIKQKLAGSSTRSQSPAVKTAQDETASKKEKNFVDKMAKIVTAGGKGALSRLEKTEKKLVERGDDPLADEVHDRVMDDKREGRQKRIK
jgi:hypothetical protein